MCLSEGEFSHATKVAISYIASGSKVGLTETYSDVMKEILDNGITSEHVAVGRALHLESDLVGLLFFLHQI